VIQNQRRGLVVDEHLIVKGADGVFAIGDASATKFAPTAQVAAQQGIYLGRLFNKLARLQVDKAGSAVTSPTSTTVAAAATTASSAIAAAASSTGNSDDGSSSSSSSSWKSWMAGWWIGSSLTSSGEESEKKRAQVDAVAEARRVPAFSEVSSDWRQRISPFEYSHSGSLCYIGNDEAIADLAWGDIRSGGKLTYLFWKSAYLSNLFSWRNKTLVLLDWCKKSIFGRDISRE
jgi:NADH:ubiquinone reductase (non-electrogenic)